MYVCSACAYVYVTCVHAYIHTYMDESCKKLLEVAPIEHFTRRDRKVIGVCIHAVRMCICYIHAYIQTYMDTYIHGCIYTWMHTYIQNMIQLLRSIECPIAYVHTYTHTYIHTYIHAYIHTHIYKTERKSAHDPAAAVN